MMQALPSTTSWQMTFRAFAAQLQAAHLAPNSIDAYVRDTRHFFQWLVRKEPEILPGQLAYRHIMDYQKMLVGIGRQATTINRRLGAIAQFCAWAKAVGLTSHNIALETDRVVMPARQPPVGLVQAESKALLQAAKHSPRGHALRNYALVQLLLQTGVLLSEAAAIIVADVTFEKAGGRLYVRATHPQAPRELPLAPSLCQRLQQYLVSRGEPLAEAPLFINERGKALNQRGIQHIVQRLADIAGITRISVSPRTLRDTFALTYLRKHPRHVVELAQLLGHKTLNAAQLLQSAL